MLRFCVVIRAGTGDYWAEYVTAHNRGEAADLVEETDDFRDGAEIVYIGVVPERDTVPEE
jgi:hypothetical protein